MVIPPYRAPLWLPGGDLQTLYAALAVPRPHVAYQRERWDTPDGDFIDLDWCGEHADGARPLLALFHGLEGSSRSPYALALMDEAKRAGWRGVVVHFRGCSGELNRLPRAYHSGDSAEVDWVVRRLRAQTTAPLYTAGVSLGGNALLKWLGEQREAAAGIVRAAAAISAPVDLLAAGNHLDRGFNMIYVRHFLKTMRRKALGKLEQHPELFDARSLHAARTLRAFDDLITAPLHGYRNTDDYWTRASAKPLLQHISVPTLLINARNDPFLPARALPQPHEVSPAVTCCFPEQGGHCGFVTGAFPGRISWLPRTLLAWMRQQ